MVGRNGGRMTSHALKVVRYWRNTGQFGSENCQKGLEQGNQKALASNDIGRLVRRVSVILATGLVLAACQTRLPNPLAGGGAPTGPVQTSDLPPLPAPDGIQGQPFDPNAPAPPPGGIAGTPQPVQQQVPQQVAQPQPVQQQFPQQPTSQPFDPARTVAAAPPLQPVQVPQQTQPVAAQPVQPVQPVAPVVQLSRADMLGAWQLVSSADSCQLFMTLTTWTGGYRATTKGCTSTELANITAWDLTNNQVVLVGATGSQVASLNGSGNRFSGATKSGSAVTVSR